MARVKVDINNLQLDDTPVAMPSTTGRRKVDISQIQLDNLTPDVGIARTALDQSLQGATFGFADEVSDRLGALGATAYSKLGNLLGADVPDINYTDALNEARNSTKQRLADEFKQNPATAIASNIGGALLTGGAGASTKLGGAVTNSLRSGSTVARIGKGALAGATSGALYGAGAADEGKRIEGAEQGAISGAVVGGAIPAIGATVGDIAKTGKNVVRGAFAKSPEAVQDAADKLKSAAGALYDKMRNVGATFKQSATQGFLIPDIDTALGKLNFIPALNPKTTAIIDDLKQQIAVGDLGLDHLDQYRRLLGRIGNTEDGVSAGAVRRVIDDFVDTANASSLANGSKQAISLLQQGRKQYAQASKYEDIADIIARAGGDANKIKAGLQRFLINDKNLRGWTKSEIATLQDAASLTGTEGIFKLAGKFGLDIGGKLNVGSGVGAGVGYLASGSNPLVPIAGTAARMGQKLAARGKAENLLNVLTDTGKAINQGNLAAGATIGTTSLRKAINQSFASLVNTTKSLAEDQSGRINPALAAGGLAAGYKYLTSGDDNKDQKLKSPYAKTSKAQSPKRTPLRLDITPDKKQPAKPQAANDLFHRVIQQESGGKQFDKKGKPLKSKVGAIGIAQLMPKTAPEAAKLAGVPFDNKKYRTDANYNAKLGKAYLSHLLDKFDGNEVHALMAYNWGKGNVRSWIKQGKPVAKVPQETKQYVLNILGAKR